MHARLLYVLLIRSRGDPVSIGVYNKCERPLAQWVLDNYVLCLVSRHSNLRSAQVPCNCSGVYRFFASRFRGCATLWSTK